MWSKRGTAFRTLYLIKDYNTAGGGKYAEYYTPHAIETIMARLLVGDNADLHNVECYDPSAGTGTLSGENSKSGTRDMITYFEKSTGVFNQNGVISDEELKAIQVRARAPKNLWHGFISLDEEHSRKIDTPEKCINLVKNTFGEFFKDMGLDPQNIDLICSLHKDKPKHLHIHFWFSEKEPKCKYRKRETEYRHKGKISQEVIAYDKDVRLTNSRFYGEAEKVKQKAEGRQKAKISLDFIDLNQIFGKITPKYPKEFAQAEDVEKDYKAEQGNMVLQAIKTIKPELYVTRGSHKVNDKRLKRLLAISDRKVGKRIEEFLSSFLTDNELLSATATIAYGR